jgi:hypothetical protein
VRREIAKLAELGEDVTELRSHLDGIQPVDDPIAVDEAISNLCSLREQVRTQFELSQKRSEQDRAEIVRRQDELRKIALSLDQELDDRRDILLKREVPTKSTEIASLLDELAACINLFRTVDRERERNVREAQEIRTDIDRLKTESRQLAALQADPSRRARAEEIASQAATLETNVPGKKHPDDAPKTVQQALEKMRRQVAELQIRKAEIATAPAPESVPPSRAEAAAIETLVFTSAPPDLERLADVYRSERKIHTVQVIR